VRLTTPYFIGIELIFHVLGLGVLFDKLQQGVQENHQVLTIARMRADTEELYASRLADIVPATDRISGGFQRDDGASVRKVGYGFLLARNWNCY
jgi:hypothetical protein